MTPEGSSISVSVFLHNVFVFFVQFSYCELADLISDQLLQRTRLSCILVQSFIGLFRSLSNLFLENSVFADFGHHWGRIDFFFSFAVE